MEMNAADVVKPQALTHSGVVDLDQGPIHLDKTLHAIGQLGIVLQAEVRNADVRFPAGHDTAQQPEYGTLHGIVITQQPNELSLGEAHRAIDVLLRRADVGRVLHAPQPWQVFPPLHGFLVATIAARIDGDDDLDVGGGSDTASSEPSERRVELSCAVVSGNEDAQQRPVFGHAKRLAAGELELHILVENVG